MNALGAFTSSRARFRRWLAVQTAGVRFMVGALMIAIVYIPLVMLLFGGSPLRHVPGMIGAAIGFGLSLVWFPGNIDPARRRSAPPDER